MDPNLVLLYYVTYNYTEWNVVLALLQYQSVRDQRANLVQLYYVT